MQVNDKAFQASAAKYISDIENQIYKDVIQAGRDTQNDSKRASPVDTGALRSGWQMRQQRTPSKIEVEVFNAVPYTKYVEYGTRRQRAQPMLRPAANKAIAKLKDRIRRYGL